MRVRDQCYHRLSCHGWRYHCECQGRHEGYHEGRHESCHEDGQESRGCHRSPVLQAQLLHPIVPAKTK